MDQPPPPPPPPHGQNPKSTSSGLPPGNYDIFIIPPHSSGSGFLYLPSLKPNVNSFAAGFASALILVVVGSALAPLVQKLWKNSEVSGGVGTVTLIFAVAVGAWALGRIQIDRETKSRSNKTGSNGSSGAYGSTANNSTHSSGQSSYSNSNSNVPPSGTGTNRGSGTSSDNNNRGPNQSHWNRSPGESDTAKEDSESADKATRDRARDDTKKKEQERREQERKERERREYERKERERREQEKREQERRECERKERERREQEKRDQERKEKERKEQERMEIERQRKELERKEQEKREQEREELKKREEAKRRKEELERRLKELREKDARERAAREQKMQEEAERVARAKIKREQEERDAALRAEEALAAKKRELEAKLREEFEAKRNEERAAALAAALAEKKQKEEDDRLRRRREYEERVKKKKAEEEAIRIWKKQRENLKRQQKGKKREEEFKKRLEEMKRKREEEIKKKREEDAKKKFVESLQPRQSNMYAFTAGEKTNPWPNGRPVSPIKETTTPSMTQPTPTKSTSQPSPTKGAFKKSDNNSTSYQASKKAQRKNSVSSLNSRSSHGPSKSSPKTKLPSMSKNNIYRTKDQNKIVIKAVYSFNNAFLKNPITQLVSGVGSVTDGLILRMTTEGLFIDDDIRNVPQREWDVKAWTMKLVELWCPSCQDSATTSASMRPAASPSDMKSKRQTMRRLWGLDKDKTATSEEIDALLSEMLTRCQNTCHVRAAAIARNMSPVSSAYSVSSFGDSAYGGSGMGRQTTEKERHDLIGLHVLRASIRDQEGKKYVFIVGQEESWKIVLGLQRLRKGTQVRALNICGMGSIEARNTLEYL
ncbi:hypothetical protein EPUL_006321, partial [Erysiphe pulchra]